MINDLFTGRWWDGSYGWLAIRNFAFRAFNPFLLPLYSKETFLVVLAGALAALLQARIFMAFMPLALLSMNYSRMTPRIYWACLGWAALNILYQLYALWTYHLKGYL